ncbi:hypothetical protein FISHEDRAFT_48690 [Fistulina hepatica ATCC 64428]|uniref:SNF2 family DNA-dependent ATPase domain-containing protein n=1 Tax=Fistulina hepatica ATCC 64428 TaxID=1128425 RepID=A0A0D7A5X0_9AGAR|nr:hypothetical protein FISHEDRAFT_48690 [Fistulina hepatica ATCC 64428]
MSLPSFVSNAPISQAARNYVPAGYASPSAFAPGLPTSSIRGTRPSQPVGSSVPALVVPTFAPASHPALERKPSSSHASLHAVIDLTGSPSPPPPPSPPNDSFIPQLAAPVSHSNLPPSLPPKTPVCIGQLVVPAVILWPTPYLQARTDYDTEWAPVRLHYEHSPLKPPGEQDTIHVKIPNHKNAQNEIIQGQAFAFVEVRVAAKIGPMLAKGLIRVDAMIRKSRPGTQQNLSPLQMLVYTPHGNIQAIGSYFRRCGLLLDHPTSPYDFNAILRQYYFNPHNPPPGGFRPELNQPTGSVGQSRWATPAVAGKSIETQREQVDSLFNKAARSWDEIADTEPSPDVATKLYPHQKKALTFLLDREREKPMDGTSFSTMWEFIPRRHGQEKHWKHIITLDESYVEPVEAKSAILADDMGLGKTITCVSLIAATLSSSAQFAADTLQKPQPPPPLQLESTVLADHFADSVWGMPKVMNPASANKNNNKAIKLQEKLEADYVRECRIKKRSRSTLIVCPLSTVANWEDQFREHWRGEVVIFGGSGGSCMPNLASLHLTSGSSTPTPAALTLSEPATPQPSKGTPLRVYVYHGTARRPDPDFLADFDVVITTYATLASEYSKQNRTPAAVVKDAEDECEEDEASSDSGLDFDANGNFVGKLPKPKKAGSKRKKACNVNTPEASSPLQCVYWFRVVLDEAHSIKEPTTVASRACCDLLADRRLCLTGTPVQNKLEDVFALLKFLRLSPFDDKNVWTEYIGSPVKYGQSWGMERLRGIMQCITLRRTKESKTQDGASILALPSRKDELRYLTFDQQEQAIYDSFYLQSKADFKELSDRNEVMKNYVGILQNILRLRQICDHYELVANKDGSVVYRYEDIKVEIEREGINAARALAIFTLLRESATTQCVDCGYELGCTNSSGDGDGTNGCEAVDAPPTKRGRKSKATGSRNSTRANSPEGVRVVMTRCQHLFCIKCYRNGVCPNWPNVAPDTRRCCSVCQTGLSPADAIEIKPDVIISDSAVGGKKKPQRRERRQKGVMSLADFHPSTKVKALLGDLVQFSRMNPYSVNYEDVQLMDKNMGVEVTKTVVFSQWTSMLDKRVPHALEATGIRYDRLDGTMKRDERNRAIDALKNDPGCEVLLVSLRAGGVGLNLTAAQRVYLMDPYWNPAVENQAVDRIHRLGQTRPVTTVKLIIANSIEARLLEVQKKKIELANMTLGGQHLSKAQIAARRMEDLQVLFDARREASLS